MRNINISKTVIANVKKASYDFYEMVSLRILYFTTFSICHSLKRRATGIGSWTAPIFPIHEFGGEPDVKFQHLISSVRG